MEQWRDLPIPGIRRALKEAVRSPTPEILGLVETANMALENLDRVIKPNFIDRGTDNRWYWYQPIDQAPTAILREIYEVSERNPVIAESLMNSATTAISAINRVIKQLDLR